MRDFFGWSETLDHIALRPLSHIRPNWELTWDREAGTYVEEEDSFAGLLNKLIDEMDELDPPASYHDLEDEIAESCRQSLKWKIQKKGSRWVGEDYLAILEQGGFDDVDQHNLVLAAVGRVRAAMDHGQITFDQMEIGHRNILGGIIANILYFRDWE